MEEGYRDSEIIRMLGAYRSDPLRLALVIVDQRETIAELASRDVKLSRKIKRLEKKLKTK